MYSKVILMHVLTQFQPNRGTRVGPPLTLGYMLQIPRDRVRLKNLNLPPEDILSAFRSSTFSPPTTVNLQGTKGKLDDRNAIKTSSGADFN